MKKYNKPEIETLALEIVDVIETSGQEAAVAALGNLDGVDADKVQLAGDIETMTTNWSW